MIVASINLDDDPRALAHPSNEQSGAHENLQQDYCLGDILVYQVGLRSRAVGGANNKQVRSKETQPTVIQPVPSLLNISGL